jgi:hypothetical protein
VRARWNERAPFLSEIVGIVPNHRPQTHTWLWTRRNTDDLAGTRRSEDWCSGEPPCGARARSNNLGAPECVTVGSGIDAGALVRLGTRTRTLRCSREHRQARRRRANQSNTGQDEGGSVQRSEARRCAAHAGGCISSHDSVALRRLLRHRLDARPVAWPPPFASLPLRTQVPAVALKLAGSTSAAKMFRLKSRPNSQERFTAPSAAPLLAPHHRTCTPTVRPHPLPTDRQNQATVTGLAFVADHDRLVKQALDSSLVARRREHVGAGAGRRRT